MLFLIAPVFAFADECPVLTDGLVLNKYFLNGCGACEKITPVIEELKSQLERANIDIKYREVECTECECEGIKSFPTIEITKDKVTTSKSVGYKNLETMTKWMAESLGIDDDTLLETHIKHKEGAVKELKAIDFLSGFDGQWLILFYKDKKEKLREYMKQIAEKDILNVGEVVEKEASGVTSRYHISEYPQIVGLNHGTAVPYVGEERYEDIQRFAKRLAQPSFESLTYKQLKDMTKSYRNGEPIYIVLYKDYDLASYYFNDIAQKFKFKALIYKSSDRVMHEAAGFQPHDDIPNQKVRLVVYKNGSFYPSPFPPDNTNATIEWIFHSHFAHVTNITNENFHAVFHGIKPVMILISEGGKFVSSLNLFSADNHLGSPFSSMIFAVLDASEYPVFKNQLLPNIPVPSLMVYDPVKVQWYYEKTELTEKKFRSYAQGLIDKYFQKKLSVYPAKKSRWMYYLAAGWVVALVISFAIKINAERRKVE